MTRQAHDTARAAMIEALAHPWRLLIVVELAVGARCVRALRAMSGAEMSAVRSEEARVGRALASDRPLVALVVAIKKIIDCYYLVMVRSKATGGIHGARAA